MYGARLSQSVFSRRERDYLHTLFQLPPGERDLPGAPWTPGYRRKLQWSIRRKAYRAMADLELLVAAAEREPRTIAAQSPSRDATSVPVYTDPFVTAIRAVNSVLARLAHRSPPSTRRKEK